MTILVVDDSMSIRALLAGILEDMDIPFEEVASGEEAVDYIEGENPLPVLVILDIGLPGIDGYETGTRIKALAGDSHLPIIFLTGARDDDILSKCLAIGDDYIAKPFTEEMVSSKIEAHRRVSELYQKVEEQNQQLKTHKDLIDREHDVVESIFANQFEKHMTRAENFRYHISPTCVFNGDVLLTAYGPSGNLYIAVGDVTGHGLPAAVGAIPVYPTFRAMAEKGQSIGNIAAHMNVALRELLPDNMMLAASLLELNSTADTLTVWSGGMPAMVLADAKGNINQLIEPTHCPLAMLADDEFSQDVQIYRVNKNERIYLFTDGVEECRNSKGELFSESRLHGLFDGSDANMFDRILEQIHYFTGGHEQDDDITLVEVVCVPNEEIPVNDSSDHMVNALPWSLHFELGVSEIKSTNPIPQIVRILSNAEGLDVHQDYISTILSEIYGNALEHGLLKLNSSMKETEDGFMDYYNLRQQRLNELQEGEIIIDLSFAQHESHSSIKIRVKDSGSGFDYKAAKVHNDEDSFGRGVDILTELCESVVYSDGGSCITVTYIIR